MILPTERLIVPAWDFQNSWASQHVTTVLTVFSYLLTLVLIRWVLLRRNRSPASTVAWICVIVFVPVVGGVLYLVFGINRVERRARRKQQAARALGRNQLVLAQHEVFRDSTLTPAQQRLMRLTNHLGDAAPTLGNHVEILNDTNRTLGLIRQAILSARESLHLEYYIWKPDKTGTALRDLLIRRAEEGIKIRFLYDGIGSMWLGRRFLRPMLKAGIQVASFLPGQSFRERWSINLRNHRKIVIVDGEIGFTGGMNIGDEYHGKNRALGYWRDTHLRLRGPAVLQLQQVFAEDWFYATGEELTQSAFFPPPDQSGTVMAQVVSGEPAVDSHAFLALFFAAINDARERITLTTSYFVPPGPLVTALETAALRGVKVRLLLAGRATLFWTVLAGRSYYDTLLKAGVEIHEYTRGLLHAKTLTIDGHWSCVGTANFDNRSLMLNFEAGVILYDERLAEQLERQYEEDLAWSIPIDPAEWPDRAPRRILLENACRLFAPVM